MPTHSMLGLKMEVSAYRHACTHSAVWSGTTLAYRDRNFG